MGPRLEGEDWPGPEALVFEFMLNALRLVDGFTEAGFESRTGLPFARALAAVREGERRGLLAAAGPGRWAPTPLGRRFLNDAQGLFLPADGG